MKFKVKKSNILLIVIYAIFLMIPNAQANCLWVEQTTWYNVSTQKTEKSGGCSDIQDQSIDGLCSGVKPVHEQVYGTSKVSVCCCDKKTDPQVASSEVCSWEKQTISEAGSTGCSSGKSIFSDDNCSETKPIYKSNSTYSYDKAICCCKSNTISVNTEKQSSLFEAPDIKIAIPGMEKLSDINCAPGDTCEIPWLGQYIRGIYNYAIAAAGILAAVVLMGGGLLWLLSRGEASKIAKAKELILGSIVGLVILTGSYLILTLINPSLVNLKNIEVVSIVRDDLGGDTDTPEISESMNTSEIAQKLGINCGEDSISQIVSKSKGKISYSQTLKTKISNNGFVYFDCSSYAYFILKCAANKKADSYSGTVFQQQVVWNKKSDWLNPGDLIGWAPKNNNKNQGHVIVYIGNNQFADCHSTKTPGGCIGNLSLERVLKYADSHSDGNLYFKRY